MIGFLAALIYSNAGEWVIHKYVLHGWGKKKTSFWNFHWGEHHNAARKNGFFDPDYLRFPIGRHAQGKELLGLVTLALAHVPLWFLSPGFVMGVWTSAFAYYLVHSKGHKNPAWAKKWLPWHVDHHMGKDQDANWCVTWPLFDHVMGTRKK